MLPGFGVLLMKVALSFMLGRITPKQLGPIMRKLYFFFISRILSSRALPSGPISLKPAEIMIMPFTPAFPHCSTMSGTVFAGVAITARSIGSGICSTVW